MREASPLRYPGGKSSLASLLKGIRQANGLANLSIAEPFAGGAGASLSLLYSEETPEVFINDADPAICDFWWALLNRPSQFATLIKETPVSITEWRRQRRIYTSAIRSPKLLHGFSAFYLNRCNRSGIIVTGGPVGGVAQAGRWKITARYNKASLLRRCARVAEYRSRIHVSGYDGIRFIESVVANPIFLFIDPPYYHKGRTLYLDIPSSNYHTQLASKLFSLRKSPWVLTYDDCLEVRRLYRGWARIRPFGVEYAASTRKMGREILITPSWMRVPNTQSSSAISW